MATEALSVQPVATPNSISLPMPRAPSPSAGGVPDPPDVALTYEVNRDTGNVIIKIVDRDTQEIIREIPPEELQRLGRAIEALVGRLLDRRG